MNRRLLFVSLAAAFFVGGCAQGFGLDGLFGRGAEEQAEDVDPRSPRAAPTDEVEEGELAPLEPGRP